MTREVCMTFSLLFVTQSPNGSEWKNHVWYFFFLPPIIVIKSSSKSNLREGGLTLSSSRYSLSWSQSQDGRRLKLLILHIHVKSREWRLLLPSDPLTLHMLPPTLRVGLPPQPHEFFTGVPTEFAEFPASEVGMGWGAWMPLSSIFFVCVRRSEDTFGCWPFPSTCLRHVLLFTTVYPKLAGHKLPEILLSGLPSCYRSTGPTDVCTVPNCPQSSYLWGKCSAHWAMSLSESFMYFSVHSCHLVSRHFTCGSCPPFHLI